MDVRGELITGFNTSKRKTAENIVKILGCSFMLLFDEKHGQECK